MTQNGEGPSYILDTIEEQNSEDLVSVQSKQGRIQTLDRMQVKGLFKHSQDILVDAKNNIFSPYKNHRDMALVKNGELRKRIEIDSITGTAVTGSRQENSVETNGFQERTGKKKSSMFWTTKASRSSSRNSDLFVGLRVCRRLLIMKLCLECRS